MQKSPGDNLGERFLVTQAKALNQRTITINILILQIIQHPAAFTNHKEQTTVRMIVVLVLLHMTSQIVNTCGEQCNLDFGRTSVTLMSRVFGNDRLLFFITQCHTGLLSCCAVPWPDAKALSIRGRYSRQLETITLRQEKPGQTRTKPVQTDWEKKAQ